MNQSYSPLPPPTSVQSLYYGSPAAAGSSIALPGGDTVGTGGIELLRYHTPPYSLRYLRTSGILPDGRSTVSP